jgi:Flp pilus assembly protein TadG
MTGFRLIRRLMTECDGAIGAEFAIVSPLLLMFLLGIVDVGRYMWSINQLEKATQMGARMAVVTNMVPSDLANLNFGATLGQGAAIPTSSFGQLHCDKYTGTLQCACDSNCSGIGMTADTAAFQLIVDRMAKVMPLLTDTNVRITYTNSGLGFAGDPNGPDVAPIVTVKTHNVGFSPLIFQIFGASTTLPEESASLTLEDGQGTSSN